MDRSKTAPALDIPAIGDDELRRLGEQLFAEVRQEYAQDAAGLSAPGSHWPEILRRRILRRRLKRASHRLFPKFAWRRLG
jgi:hypothetical protein